MRTAARAGGPTTARGKAISRWNSLQHGFYAKRLRASDGKHRPEHEEFQQVLQALREDLQPTTVEAEFILEQVAADYLRRAQAIGYEIAAVNTEQFVFNSGIDRLMRYSALVGRSWSNSLQLLQKLRQQKEAAEREGSCPEGDDEPLGTEVAYPATEGSSVPPAAPVGEGTKEK